MKAAAIAGSPEGTAAAGPDMVASSFVRSFVRFWVSRAAEGGDDAKECKLWTIDAGRRLRSTTIRGTPSESYTTTLKCVKRTGCKEAHCKPDVVIE